MRIYIASSWKNQHGVELLTDKLREMGHEVISWVENNYGETHNHVTKEFDFETWVNTPESDQSFEFDTHGAMGCDLFIYYGPAGKDAAAECGMCYGQRLAGKTIPMYGLVAKGEDFGLMRKMFDAWFDRWPDLLARIGYAKRSCRECGCTDDDCRQCIEAQGHPCSWVDVDLCSRCANQPKEASV